MKAVSNTTPLRYLIAIEQEHLLGQLFEKVFVPAAVHQELMDAKTPETVRNRVLTLPAWFEVRTVQETQKTTFPVTLHRGEREAILLAEALRADLLLVDESGAKTVLGTSDPAQIFATGSTSAGDREANRMAYL